MVQVHVCSDPIQPGLFASQSSACFPPTYIRHLDLCLFSWLPTFHRKLVFTCLLSSVIFTGLWFISPQVMLPEPPAQEFLSHPAPSGIAVGFEGWFVVDGASLPCSFAHPSPTLRGTCRLHALPPGPLLPWLGAYPSGTAFIHITTLHRTLDLNAVTQAL